MVEQDINGVWFIEIDAHDRALPLMFDFKSRYFNYQLWNALRLRSPNQLRMYELLKQYEPTGKRSLNLEELRFLLGIEPNEYPRWNNFKAKIIDSCQKALSETTDIKYTYEPIRNGRGGKVTGVRFFIEKNEDYVDQITLYEFIERQDNEVFVPEEKEQRFENQNLELFADMCEWEFSECEIQVLYDIVVEVADVSACKGFTERELKRARYFKAMYNELKCVASKKKVFNRFTYLKGILENKRGELR
jgi:plasmid replication initiation protein